MLIESLETRRMFTGWIVAGDFNYDPLVNIGDFSQLAANFNQSVGSSWRSTGDLNSDGRVDLNDFNHFCQTADPSSSSCLILNSAGPGDADGNGRIDKYDIRTLGASFNQNAGWVDGDFSLNSRVDIQDFALAAANVIARS